MARVISSQNRARAHFVKGSGQKLEKSREEVSDLAVAQGLKLYLGTAERHSLNVSL